MCITAVAQLLALPFSIIRHEKCLLGRLHRNMCISLVRNDLCIFERELQPVSQKPRRQLEVRDLMTASFKYYFVSGILTERKTKSFRALENPINKYRLF